MIYTQTYTLATHELADVKMFANQHNHNLNLVEINGLGLKDTGSDLEADTSDESLVQGVLVEGLQRHADDYGTESLVVTVWAAGAMHDINTQPDVGTIRVILWDTEDRLPLFTDDRCGRCNRNFVPGCVQSHIGC